MLVGKHKVSFHRFFYWGKAVFINGMKTIFGERKRKVAFINEMRTIFQREVEKSGVHKRDENRFSKERREKWCS
ncbi:hypothetical protein BACSP_02887 [Bacillus sp. T2.9-1]|nr:hypothetical protein BACSP_02887 [Bacillus sp. T2.9-1]